MKSFALDNAHLAKLLVAPSFGVVSASSFDMQCYLYGMPEVVPAIELIMSGSFFSTIP